MTLAHALFLLFLGVTLTIGLFVLLGKLEENIEHKKKDTD